MSSRNDAKESLISSSMLEDADKNNHPQLSVEEEMEELVPELRSSMRMVRLKL